MQSNKQTSITKPNSTLSQVYTMYSFLTKTIDDLDSKIQQVIKQHQAQFLFAYRNHLKSIKEQLTDMKQATIQQQKRLMSNDHVLNLQKQIIIFREQALRLYDKLQEVTEQNQMNKNIIKDLQKVKTNYQRQNKEVNKNNKFLNGQIIFLEDKIKQLTQDIQIMNAQKNKDSLIREKTLMSKKQTLNSLQQPINIQDVNLYQKKHSFVEQNIEIGSKKYSKIGQLSIHNKLSSAKEDNKLSSGKDGSKLYSTSEKRKGFEWMDYELKSWFTQCIQNIRKQINNRKYYGYKTEDLSSISSFQDFKMTDKLKLLEMFMQNQKLLVWMYEKIFPTRINQLQQYLMNKNVKSTVNREKAKSMKISLSEVEGQSLKMKNNEYIEVLQLQASEISVAPITKLTNQKQKQHKIKKYSIRNRIDMKNGKLNLSQMQDNY